MAKDKSKKKKKQKNIQVQVNIVHEADSKANSKPKMNRKSFDKEMEKLQVELVKLQEWVKATGSKICVVFD